MRNWTWRGQGTKRNGQEAPEARGLHHDPEPVPIIPLCATYGPTEAKASEPRAATSRRSGGSLSRRSRCFWLIHYKYINI